MAPFKPSEAGRVRELCRQLKPIIGPQADRIWLGFVAENEEGKAQILDYLELLAAQQFQGDLDTEGPGLLPPGPATATGEYPLGTVVYNDRPLYPWGLRENEWPQHVGVFGRSGAGKTNLGFMLVQELMRKQKPIWVLDWKRSYRQLLSLPESELPGVGEMAVYTIGRSASPLSFNPLIPPPQTNPKTWLKKLIGVVSHAYLLGDGVMFLLQEAFDRVYEEAGVYSGSVKHWPTFRDVLQHLRRRQTTGREAGWMSSALRALASLCFGEMDTLVNQGHTNLQSLLDRTVIFELDALTQSDKVFFVQAVLLWLHHLRMAEPARESFKHAVVIEEAHHVLTDLRSSLVGGQSTMDIVYREIREFGEAIIALDQHPSQISMPALGNTYCTICFNLKHKTDVSAMAQAMMLQDEAKDVLGNLQVGQAVVRLQGRSAKPFMIAVPEFKMAKGTIADVDVVHHMIRLGLQSARDISVSTNASAVFDEEHMPQLSGGQTTLASLDEVFLLDVEHFPDSGVAERYKRLGLSVRQGQKLKDRLIAAGLVHEEVQTTHRGRVRVIRLTEEGKLSLSTVTEPDHELT